jgi:hypothetical protein
MRFTAKRLIGAGVIATVAIVAPISVTALTSGPTSTAFAATASSCPQDPTYDIICYNQSTGNAGTFAQYTPGPPPPNGKGTAGTTTAATASLTSGGGCAIPRWSTSPLINFAGTLYQKNDYTDNPPPAQGNASVDAAKQKTGVCGISGGGNPWAIDNISGAGAEELDFLIGNNPNMGSNRLFAGASLDIANNNASPTTVTYIETQNGAPVQTGTQSCPIPGGFNGTLTTSCSGVGPSAPFDTLEVRVAVGGSISVVGPSSIFDLAPVACTGVPVPASDPNGTGVVASMTVTSVGQCKTYTSFSTTISGGVPTLSFNGFSSAPVQFTVNIKWPAQALCSPYADVAPNGTFPGGSTGVPGSVPGSTQGITDVLASPPYPGLVGGAAADMCPVHQFQFNGIGFTDQAYCQGALAPPPQGSAVEPQQELCTVSKAYNNDVLNANGTVQTDANGNPVAIPGPGGLAGTQVVENWDGYIDYSYH